MTRHAGLRDRYERDGYSAPLEALAPKQAAAYRQRVLELAGRRDRLAPDERTNAHLRYPWAAELATLPAVLDAVEAVLGPDLLVWRASFFYKGASDPSFVAWHQDSVYWDLEGDAVATAWLALTDSTEANGCVRVLPGSHRAPPLPHAVRLDGDNVLLRGQAVAVPIDEPATRPLVLAAGQFSLHHVGIVHGSPANRSGSPRIGFAVRYAAPRVRPRGARQGATLVRGEDRFGNFDAQPLPRFEGDPLAAAAAARARRRMIGQLLRQLRRQSPWEAGTTLLRLARRPGTARALARALFRR